MLRRFKPQELHWGLGHVLIPSSSFGHWAGAGTWGAKRAYCKSTCLLILDQWLSQRPGSALQDRETESGAMGLGQPPSALSTGTLSTGREHSGQRPPCSAGLWVCQKRVLSQQESCLFGI